MRETSRRPRRLSRSPPDAGARHGVSAAAVCRLGRLAAGACSGRCASCGAAVGVLLWTLPCMPVQAVCLMLPGRAKVVFARFYWSMVCRLLGLQVRVIGAAAGRAGGRPVVFVSNHSSWLDIPVLGGRLDACFVSKDEVGRWPLVGTIARLGRTVFISRQRHATGRERDAMRERLAAGDNLMLFPEGTTSDGSRVLPFRSAFFAIAEGADPPLIQPVSVVYDRLGGLPDGASQPAGVRLVRRHGPGVAFLAVRAASRAAGERPAASAARSGALRQPQGAVAGGVAGRWRTAPRRCGRTGRWQLRRCRPDGVPRNPAYA